MSTLTEWISRANRPAPPDLGPAGEKGRTLFRLRASLPDPRGKRGIWQGADEPEWSPARFLGICGRLAKGPIEKKPFFHAFLGRGLDFRHAGV